MIGDHSHLRGMSRREVIAALGALGGAAALGLPEHLAQAATSASARGLGTVRAAASTKPHGSDLGAVEHVVFLMMENRSYDHYFGAYPRGRGFDDHPKHSLGPFAQRYTAAGGQRLHPRGKLLPFHLTHGAGEDCTKDLTHNWGPQHLCWNHGKMNRFVATHTAKSQEGDPDGALTMGYYTRREIPFYWALADHFTLLDRYHCSVLGPTHPNRVMSLSGTIDPSGRHGGPITDTNPNPDALWSCSWSTMPEVLEDAGVSWKVYHPDSASMVARGYPTWDASMYSPIENPLVMLMSDHVLPYFKAYENPTSPLHKKAFNPTFPGDFGSDIARGKLPHVSWIIPPLGFDDHPSANPHHGQWFVRQVLKTLASNKKVWSKTVLFLMYDENDGWFDHMRPPVPPRGTPNEELTAATISSDTNGIRHPIGLGVRVPALMISPFAVGGHVAGQVFDHTSQLKFLHTRFGVEIPHLSAWRRETVGDLTSALFRSTPHSKLPHLGPAPLGPYQSSGSCAEPVEETEEGGTGPTIPVHQRMPTQHGTTEPASKYFPTDSAGADRTARVPATSRRNTATLKSSVNPLAHGGKRVTSAR